MRHTIAYTAICLILLAIGCQATGDTADSSSGTNSGASGASGGAGGAGATMVNGGGGSGATGGGTAGAGGTFVDPCTMDTVHLLLSEVATQPATDEYVEIWNPSTTAVDLSNYYLSDNSVYHGIASGTAWAPGGTPDTDFLVQFPAGTIIDAGGVLTIEFGTDFEGLGASCPDLTVRDNVMCNGNAVPQMITPTNGGLGANVGSLLSNDGEMLMLFCWGGGDIVYDVDYVNWDDDSDPNTHVDKSAVAGYQPDTSEANQAEASKPAVDESIGRCTDMENGETTSGGNGLLGHDETSENFAVSWRILVTSSPGSVNSCL